MSDKFELIKGLGIEAKLKQVDKVTLEAATVVAQLRTIALISSRSILQQYSNAWKSPAAPEVMDEYSVSRDIQDNLIALDVPVKDIRAVLTIWCNSAARRVVWNVRMQLATIVLSNRISGAASNDEDNLMNYFQEAWHDVRGTPSQLIAELANYEKDATRAAQRVNTTFQPGFLPAVSALTGKWMEQLQYLADQQDFKDPSLWSTLARREYS